MDDRFGSDFGGRVHILMLRCGGANELSRRSGLSRRVLDKYRSGESDPNRERLIALAEAGEVNIQWLVTGEGPMVPEPTEGREVFSLAHSWLMSRVVDGIQRTYKEVGASLPPASLGELAARIHNEIVQLEGGEDVWRGALALALGRLKAELTEAATTGTGKSSVSS